MLLLYNKCKLKLQPTTGEMLSNSSAIYQALHCCKWVLGRPLQESLLQSQDFNPHAPSNGQPLPTSLKKGLTSRWFAKLSTAPLPPLSSKQMVREVKHGSFTPVFSLTGGLENLSPCYKHLVS